MTPHYDPLLLKVVASGASRAEAIAAAIGWSEPLYRAWYLTGAVWTAGWLGLGTAFLLGRTRRIRVGTAVSVLPTQHPQWTRRGLAEVADSCADTPKPLSAATRHTASRRRDWGRSTECSWVNRVGNCLYPARTGVAS